jgi:2-oxoglutarate dehydrogenase E1 component
MAIRDRHRTAASNSKPAAPAAESPLPPNDLDAKPLPADHGREIVFPIQGAEARLAAHMNESLAVPTATSFREVDVAMLVAERTWLNEALVPGKLSYTHLLAFVVAQAVAIHPRMAAFYREIDGRPHRVEPVRIGLGIAVDVEQRDGTRYLVVPVIAGVDDLGFPEFVAAYDDLVERARSGRLGADDLTGGTITLTNPGTVGTTASVPRLMAGQGTIVAAGAVRQVGGGWLMTISSTYDHRVTQGAESGGFLGTVDELLHGADGFYDYIATTLGLPGHAPTATGGEPAPTPLNEASARSDIAAAGALVRSYRTLGHRAALLDPLGTEPLGDPALDPATWGLTAAAMARIPAALLHVDVRGESLAEVVPELQQTYCGRIAFEVEHISSHDERAWLRRAIESGDYRAKLTADRRRLLLARLTAVEALERFLGHAFLGHKRFSIEGLDVLIPMLDQLIELVAASGTRTIGIGMAHRGRLNVLAHTVGVPYADILADFEHARPSAEAEPPAEGETSDVAYHRGADGVYESAAGPVKVIVPSNPSHLEAIDPVVEGRARAAQTDRSGAVPAIDPAVAVAVLIHGDASFAAQGIVAETFNLARLPGYTTGGTIHLIANNQLGFTVEPRDGRSTDYASDLAKGFDAPIIHVNADDPEACLSAIRLGHAYRERFQGDVVIDVVGYRRYGHNETDEPAYTQPVMYERIGDHPSVRRIYAQRLAAEEGIDEGQADEELAAAEGRLAEIQASLEVPPKASRPERTRRSAKPGRSLRTAVAAEQLLAINEGLIAVPPEFTVHPKLVPQIDRRRAALERGGRIDWAQAEALAFGSLLLDGTPIRLTGQDTERGTFSQRHLVFHDATNGRRYAPIQHLADARAPFELHDSPLSEFACLGFEYGYAVEVPEALVLWEAQYGDFANEAEVIIDQFIIAGLAKWGETSRLTLLLPHGYEGQGPEHSSARLERYLALGAEDNIRVANCTTPTQYFHLLRDQARREPARPLVLMSPKGLLRLPAASASLGALTRGHFRPVLDDPAPTGDRGQVRRLVLCSGRLYYDLAVSPRRAKANHVAIARLELLYPFPAVELGRLVKRYPTLETVIWAQEEPRNMGARKFVLPELQDVVRPGLPITDVSRPERSSPAEGSHAVHRAEQARIVKEALAR